MNKKTIQPSHSLLLGGSESLDIYPEYKRLYKFVSWFDAKPKVKEFLISRIKLKSSLNGIENFDLDLKAVNPMRRSRFGSFYLDVTADIIGLDGKIIANMSDLEYTNVPIENYKTFDEKEKGDRESIEKAFGKDQYSKEFAIQTQALEELLRKEREIVLKEGDLDSIDNFVNQMMGISGWTDTKDNRLHSRVKRLPPFMEIPE